ncbi:MAG: MurR/RpiR family transcriptional regulator [Rhodanobacteraceae bacterium]
MTRDLEQKLKVGWQTFTTSEQKIAAYLLRNLNALPFETAASIGKGAGVSAMTVGRFLRKLGYVGVGAMKDELRGDPSWIKKLYKKSTQSGQAGSDRDDLDAEIRALSEVQALTHSTEWQPVVDLLDSAERISVASFQLGRFLGITFVTLLQQVRSGVVFADGSDGAYTDVLVDLTEKDCAVLIDERRYSKHFRILAEQVAARGVPLIIITDTQCYWARELTPHVLMISVRDDRPWHNFSAFTTLFSALLGGVVRELGDEVYARIQQITNLRQQFIGFSGAARQPGRAGTRGSSKAVPAARRGRKPRRHSNV